MSEEIKRWLDNLGLGKYADAFIFHDIDVNILSKLTNDDFKELGVSIGNRHRLRMEINYQDDEISSIEIPSKPASVVGVPPEPQPQKSIPSNDAERRPLTVMFCDLADSTALSTKLDPEDLQDVIRAYQEACTALIQEYEGYVARYMGDGILVYFGYPKSLERNAERAVRTALSIVDGMAALNQALGAEHDIEIAVRIGIATGMVMVGEVIGEGLAQERTVVGEAPNIAARLQGLAERNGIVIGSLTRELTGDVVIYTDMGSHELKGITGLVQTWGVVGLRDDIEQGEADSDNDGNVVVPELVGRDEETGLLRRAWQSVQEEGHGQVVAIGGEAGIGKSVLVDGLRSDVRASGLPQLVIRCSPYHSNSAFYPVIEYFKRLAGWQSDDSTDGRIEKLESMFETFEQTLNEAMPLMAALLTLPLPEERFPPLTLSPQQLKQQTQDLVIAMTLEVAEKEPFLQVWEDLHWADPSTLELIALQIDQVPTSSLLMLLTARPEFIPPWPARSHITPITLNRLETQHTQALITRIADRKPLPEEVVDHIVTKADGVPLYVEELTKTILDSDILRDTGERFELTGPLTSLSIPDTLQDSLMARLDRLPQVRELAQLGSVLGREFAYEMISGLSTGGETILQKGLEQLVDAELLYQRGRPPRAKYIFKHALIRDAAYGSLLRRTREQYHLQVATLIESRFPDTIESNPELIAHHYFEAGESELAIDYFQKAGARAMLTSANQEAIAHLTKGLEILDTMSENPERDQQELSLLMAIGPALIATKGYAASEVEPAYFRALEICRKLGEAEKEFSVVLGLSLYFFVKAELPKSKELSHQLVELAKGREDPGPDLSADRALGYAMGFMGDLEESRELMDRVAASYDYDKHGTYAFRHGGSDFGVGALGSSAWIYFALGYPDQAKDRGKRSVALAQKLNHPISEAAALFFLSVYYTLTGEFNLAHEHSRETLKIAEERGFVQYVAWGGIVHNSSLFAQDGSEAAIDGMREAIQLNRKIGSNLFIPYWNILLVRALAKKDQVNEGLHLIEETIAEINISKERIWEAELYRVKGQLLLKNDEGNAPEAENCFRKSIDIAQSQSAKGWELRAATGLARLWQSQEKTDEARDLLKPVYDWFTEGFDTDDLRKAKTVLVELA